MGGMTTACEISDQVGTIDMEDFKRSEKEWFFFTNRHEL